MVKFTVKMYLHHGELGSCLANIILSRWIFFTTCWLLIAGFCAYNLSKLDSVSDHVGTKSISTYSPFWVPAIMIHSLMMYGTLIVCTLLS